MIDEIKVSIIVPAFNVSNYIDRCLRSVTRQTYRNLEIIVINDGSSDRTGIMLGEWAASDNRIIAINQENHGLIEVRELGIKIATGQYIGFVDGDDEIEVDMIERLLKNALKYQAQISQCGILYCYSDGETVPMHGTGELHVYNRVEGLRELLHGQKMEPSLCNKLYESSVLTNSCPDKTVMNNEDLLRNSVAFSRVTCSVFEDFCGYHYWRREDSMSNNNKKVQIQKHVLNARRLILESVDRDVWDAALESYVMALISTCLITYNEKNNEAKQLLDDCKNELRVHKNDFNRLSDKVRVRAVAALYLLPLYSLAKKCQNLLVK